MMAIRILVTGGTIDCERIEGKYNYLYSRTFVPDMLLQGRCSADVRVQVLMLKKSGDIDSSDMEAILAGCTNCEEDRIIITCGTFRLAGIAGFLGPRIDGKTVVLLGAMVPYMEENSDALFNLGSAVTAVQLLPSGVYIAMNGRIFPWDDVAENMKTGFFEPRNKSPD